MVLSRRYVWNCFLNINAGDPLWSVSQHKVAKVVIGHRYLYLFLRQDGSQLARLACTVQSLRPVAARVRSHARGETQTLLYLSTVLQLCGESGCT